MPLARSTSISWVTLPWRKGQRGGEFFTPTSLVKLIVEILQPFQGRILDPACGSGGMFVQSAEFIHNHQGRMGTVRLVFTERNGSRRRSASVR